jgi:lipopolysaccharide/colanic/teichoic acid biosynthesis glycosyltransferase
MPLLVLIGLAVLVDQGRPILFRQVRPGRSMRRSRCTSSGPCAVPATATA